MRSSPTLAGARMSSQSIWPAILVRGRKDWPDRRLHNRGVLRLSGPDVSSNSCARAIAGPRVR